MRIYYTAYITTNLINNKEYIGVHKTKNLNDDYLGSGTALKRAVNKYGPDSFNKKIIALFETKEAMYAWEKLFITQHIVEDELFYNLKLSGTGDWSKASQYNKGKPGHTVGYKHSLETRIKIGAASKNRSKETRIKIGLSHKGKTISKEHRMAISVAQKGRAMSKETRDKISAAMTGKHHSPESRAKMSDSKRRRDNQIVELQEHIN